MTFGSPDVNALKDKNYWVHHMCEARIMMLFFFSGPILLKKKFVFLFYIKKIMFLFYICNLYYYLRGFPYLDSSFFMSKIPSSYPLTSF